MRKNRESRRVFVAIRIPDRLRKELGKVQRHLEEELEKRHSSLSGADAEISGADISIDTYKDKTFILISLSFNIVVDDEIEDKTKIDIKIFSNKNILIS